MPNCYKLLETIQNIPTILNPKLTGDKISDKMKLNARDNFLKQYPDKAVPVNPEEWLTTPGGKVIQRWNRNQQAISMDDFLVEFCTVFHSANTWTWFGGNKCPLPLLILDGDKNEGECLALAKAFRVLATCGNGFGLTYSTAEVLDPVTYKGRREKGFISNHPLDGILNLPPNVYPPLDGMPDHSTALSPFYYWANHKTVPYNGKYYDPSYRTTYMQLEDMAVYHVVSDDNPSVTDVVCKLETATGTPVFFIEFSEKRSLFLRPNRKPPVYMGPYSDEGKAKSVLQEITKVVI